MKDTFYFGFRYERGLGKKIRAYCRKEMISRNHLVDRVLVSLADRYDAGKMDLFEPSRFRNRLDKGDKVSTSLILSDKKREMLRNLAFAYRISMAEVIRLGLEMYLDAWEKRGKSGVIIHAYRAAKTLIHTVIISLYPALARKEVAYPLLL